MRAFPGLSKIARTSWLWNGKQKKRRASHRNRLARIEPLEQRLVMTIVYDTLEVSTSVLALYGKACP
jgi:hypothetical protein